MFGALKALQQWAQNMLAFVGLGPSLPDNATEIGDPYAEVPDGYRRELTKDRDADVRTEESIARARKEVDALWPTLAVELPAFFRKLFADAVVYQDDHGVIWVKSFQDYPDAAIAVHYRAAAKRIVLRNRSRELRHVEPQLMERDGKAWLRIDPRGPIPDEVELHAVFPLINDARPTTSTPRQVLLGLPDTRPPDLRVVRFGPTPEA